MTEPADIHGRSACVDHGRVAYVTFDGGTTAPPGGIVRNAALLRAELRARAA